MKFSIFSTLAIVSAAMATAVPQKRGDDPTFINAKTESKCIKPFLCCGELKTPLDSTVDGILAKLDIGGESIVGSIGLDCKAYDHTCETGPKCCTEANLLGGTVALGCADVAK